MDPAEHYQLDLPYKPSSVSVYWKKITIPKGLPALLETYVKECIRQNPDDIYKFLADLTESLLAKRSEEQEAESAPNAAAPASASSKEKQAAAADEESPLLDSASPPIQTACKVEELKETTVQPRSTPASPSLTPQASTESNQHDDAPLFDGASLAEEILAAAKIQAGFRGYQTRKALKGQKSKEESKSRPGSPSPIAVVPEGETNEPTSTAASEEQAPPPVAEQVVVEQITGTVTEAVASSPPPQSPSPQEVNDEEIAAELKTPLETIREESFDHSSSSHGGGGAIPPPVVALAPSPAEETENGPIQEVLLEEAEAEEGSKSSSPAQSAEDVVNDDGNDDEASVNEVSEPAVSPQRISSASAEPRAHNVAEISHEDISSALAADSTSEDSGEDPSLREAGVTKGAVANDDINNKNDEMEESPSPLEIPESSPTNEEDINDEIPEGDQNSALGQSGDHQSETGTGAEAAPTPTPSTGGNEDGKENPESVDDDGVEDNLEPETQNDGDAHEDGEEQGVGVGEGGPLVVNLSSSADATEDRDDGVDSPNGRDQTPICTEKEEDCGDKNKKSDVADENVDVEDAEKNTTNIISPDTGPQQEEVGQQAEEEDDGKVEDEKTELLQQSGSALTESSGDREDTDIATPTDFSTHEERESETFENFEETKTPAEEVDQEVGGEEEDEEEIMETGSNPGGDSAGNVEAVSPPPVQTPTEPLAEVSSASSTEASSSEPGAGIQVEIKPNEPASSPTPSGDEVKSPEPTEPKSEGETPSPQPIADEKPISPEAIANVEQAQSPAPEQVAETAAPAEDAKSPEPPIPILRPEGESQPASEAQSPAPSVDEKPAETPSATSPSPSEAAENQEGVKSPEPSQTPTSPEPVAADKAKSPEPSETPTSPAPAETPTSPAPASETPTSPAPASETPTSPAPASETSTSPAPASESPEAVAESPKSPEPATESPKSPEPVADSPKSPEQAETPTTPAEAQSPPPAENSSPEPTTQPEAAVPVTETVKTDSVEQVASSPTPSAETPAPEGAVSPAPTPSEEKSESATTTAETVIATGDATSPPPPPASETPTNQATGDSVPTTNDPPGVPGDASDQVTPPPAGDSAVDTSNIISTAESSAMSVPSDSAAPDADINERKDIATVVVEEKGEESRVVRQEKPVVKPRLSSRQATLVKEESAAKEESSISVASAAAADTSDPAAVTPGSESSSSSPPVLRRPKSGSGRNRSRAATSKYRSGLVIDNQVSMEQMEKEIEDEMMNSAATKIQAGFRGFKTRKVLSTVGVSKKARKDETCGAEVVATPSSSACEDDNAASAAADAISEDASSAAAGVIGSAGEDDFSNVASGGARVFSASRGGKPPLGCLRSRSYPGSHEDPADDFDEGDEDRFLNPEPDIDLELDPDYINRAATKIQANFRGYQVRKSFKRPGGKENNGSKTLTTTKIPTDAEIEAEQRAKVMETHERLQQRDTDNASPHSDSSVEPERAAAKIQASFRSYKERQKFHEKKKAAIKIQASVRGYLTRKRLANLRRRSFQRRRSSAKAFQKELEQMRKVNEAATKIQAVFRGYQVRSKMPRSSMINEEEQVIDE